MTTYPLRLVIHGGAGVLYPDVANKTDDRRHHEALKKALTQGFAILKKHGSSMDAVCKAVTILENFPLFNAGRGSVLNQTGNVEMDAAIMDGATLKAGAVAGISRLRNPILIARLIQQHSKHMMLVGRSAENFARHHGLQWIDPETLITKQQLMRWQAVKNKKVMEQKSSLGTVGAVALDAHGNLAAATSTGGMIYKTPGRVGDTPIIGAGTYADNNSCAVSATGHGEYFMSTVFAYDVGARMRYQHLSLDQAGEKVLNHLHSIGGEGGFIAVDRQGNISINFNTEIMYRGFINEHEMITSIE